MYDDGTLYLGVSDLPRDARLALRNGVKHTLMLSSDQRLGDPRKLARNERLLPAYPVPHGAVYRLDNEVLQTWHCSTMVPPS